MRDQFPYLGIPMPPLRVVWRQVLAGLEAAERGRPAGRRERLLAQA